MINYLLSSFIAISFIFQLDPDFNESPLKKEMEKKAGKAGKHNISGESGLH